MKPIYNILDLFLAFVLGCLISYLVYKGYSKLNYYQSLSKEVEVKQQTIHRLQVTLSQLDTIHSQCFKINEK